MKTQSIPTAIGIDVAKATLSVCIRYSECSERALKIRNTNTDISKKLLPYMKKYTGKVVMESTGHYHWTSALMLSEVGHDVRVVNPILAKQYTSGNIRKVKTDPSDASGLARMAHIADNLPRSFSDDRDTLFMRKRLGLLSSASKQLQALTACLASVREAERMVDRGGSGAVDEIEGSIAQLKKSLRRLENECVSECKKDPETKRKGELLTTIPGMSDFCSQLCLHWFSIKPGDTYKSWIAYAGLDVSSRESGTWKGVCRLTKRGNAFLRKRLYSAAWGAWMSDPNFKIYYTTLREQKNRSHVAALTIIARKLVRISYEVLKTETPYDASKCFNLIGVKV